MYTKLMRYLSKSILKNNIIPRSINLQSVLKRPDITNKSTKGTWSLWHYALQIPFHRSYQPRLHVKHSVVVLQREKCTLVGSYTLALWMLCKQTANKHGLSRDQLYFLRSAAGFIFDMVPQVVLHVAEDLAASLWTQIHLEVHCGQSRWNKYNRCNHMHSSRSSHPLSTGRRPHHSHTSRYALAALPLLEADVTHCMKRNGTNCIQSRYLLPMQHSSMIRQISANPLAESQAEKSDLHGLESDDLQERKTILRQQCFLHF